MLNTWTFVQKRLEDDEILSSFLFSELKSDVCRLFSLKNNHLAVFPRTFPIVPFKLFPPPPGYTGVYVLNWHQFHHRQNVGSHRSSCIEINGTGHLTKISGTITPMISSYECLNPLTAKNELYTTNIMILENTIHCN